MIDPHFQPKIIGFLCNWCSYRAADLAGTARIKYPPNVRVVRSMCSGRVDPVFVLKAFADGADGVMIAGCHPGECHYLEQNYKTIRRFVMLRHALRALGIEDDRIRLQWASAAEGAQLAAAIHQMVERRARPGAARLAQVLGLRSRPGRGAPPARVGPRQGGGGSGMSDKPKLAVYWAASCGGCDIATLAIDEKILDVAAAFDIVFWPCVMDGKVADVEAMPDGGIDVCLFNGAIRTTEHEHMAQLLRRRAKVLVAFGSCAHEGCIPGLANLSSREEIFDTVYHDDRRPPRTRTTSDRRTEVEVPEGTLHLPVFYDTLQTLDQTVPVDYYLPGCPPEADRIWDAVHGDPRAAPAGQGLGDRRGHDRLRRVPADAEREEDQGVQAHLGDHPGRRDLPAGAGAPVLRHRHAGGLRCAVPAGQLALHRLLRPERRRRTTTAPA